MRSFYSALIVTTMALLACRHDPMRQPGTRAAQPLEVKELIYDGGLQGKWQDDGWSARTVNKGPAQIDFSNHGGWILTKPASPLLASMEAFDYAALSFRYQAPARYLDFLEVRIDSAAKDTFPRIVIAPEHRVDMRDGWSEVLLPMPLLNPDRKRFNRIVIRAAGEVPNERVTIDRVVFTRPEKLQALQAQASGPPRDAFMVLDCVKPAKAVHPMVFGIAYDPRKEARDSWLWNMHPAARRWGGNTTSRYNWKLGNAWNTASDWFFRNVNFTNRPDYTYENFFEQNEMHQVLTALTIPMLGWVAKDTTSVGFSRDDTPNQRGFDAQFNRAGDGFYKDGKPVPSRSPQQTSVAAPASFMGDWVKAIVARDKRLSRRSAQLYYLDNEPSLWSSTHRDVHPTPTTYDELLSRTIDYGTAIRQADPQAVIAGPAEWGWPGYNFSGKDADAGFKQKPDRRAHGDMPLIPWYLTKLREHEQRTGVKILDMLDVHYYPMGEGVGGARTAVDRETSAKRIRATRSLWDPTYKDESWIDDKVRLLPRLQEWVDAYYPGLGISIGEYNFGAEHHMSGALAQAEALGRFIEHNVKAAFYFDYPTKDSPVFNAFRAYRDYDGKGGHFLDLALSTRTPSGVSLFASRDLTGSRIVAIALNFDPDRAVAAEIDTAMCGQVLQRKTYGFSQSQRAFSAGAQKKDEGTMLHETLPPYSITVFELQLVPNSPTSVGSK